MSAQIQLSKKIHYVPKPVSKPKSKKFANIFPLESKEKVLERANAAKALLKTGDEDPSRPDNVLAALRKTRIGSMKKPTFEEDPEDICILKCVGDLSNFEPSPEFSFQDPPIIETEQEPIKNKNPLMEDEEEFDPEIPEFKIYLDAYLLRIRLEMDKEVMVKQVKKEYIRKDYQKELTKIRLKADAELQDKFNEDKKLNLEMRKWRQEKEKEATIKSNLVGEEYSKSIDRRVEAVYELIKELRIEDDKIVQRHNVALQPIKDAYAKVTAYYEYLCISYAQRGATLAPDVVQKKDSITTVFSALIQKSDEDILTEDDIASVQRELSLIVPILSEAAANIPGEIPTTAEPSSDTIIPNNSATQKTAVIQPCPGGTTSSISATVSTTNSGSQVTLHAENSESDGSMHVIVPQSQVTLHAENSESDGSMHVIVPQVSKPLTPAVPHSVALPMPKEVAVELAAIQPKIGAEFAANKPKIEEADTELKKKDLSPKTQIVVPELKEAHDRYVKIKNKMDEVSNIANAPKNDSPVWINLVKATGIVNQLKNKSHDPSNRGTLQQVFNLLAGRTCYIGDMTVSTEGHPVASAYIAHHLSANIINLAHDLQASCMAVYASVIVKIWMTHAHVGELIYGRLCEVCPFIVPITPVREHHSEDEYHQLMGFRQKREGGIEKLDNYLNRMGAAARLYGRIVGMEVVPHPHGVEEGWKFLARLLILPPFPNVSASIIFGFLSTAGHTLLRAYGRQFAKTLYFIGIVYLPKLEKVTVEGGLSDLEELKKFLIEFHQKNYIPPPPEGNLLMI